MDRWVHASKGRRDHRRILFLTAYWFTFCHISKSRPKLAPSVWVSSSSSCGSGTRSWPVGRWGSDGRIALSAAAWWWTHSSWIRLLVQPAGVWNMVCASFWSECALGTRGQLEERRGGGHKGLDTTAEKSLSPPRLRSLYEGYQLSKESLGGAGLVGLTHIWVRFNTRWLYLEGKLHHNGNWKSFHFLHTLTRLHTRARTHKRTRTAILESFWSVPGLDSFMTPNPTSRTPGPNVIV